MPAPAATPPAPCPRPFLALLPAIRAHARDAFRHLRSEHDREDAEAEVVARSWKRFRAAGDAAAVTADRLAGPAVAAVRGKLARARG